MPCARFVAVPPTQRSSHLKRSQQAEFGFNPFLEILSAVEQEFLPQQQPKRRKTVITPRFDIRETEDAFFVEGELPGVSDKETIDIQFTDVQTLTVKGEITRSSSPAATADTEEQAEVERPKSPTKSLKSTVEDSVDESSSGDVTVQTPSSATLSEGVEATNETPVASSEVVKEKEQKPKSKYWVRERSVGVFERSFEFQSLIDPEGVKASLAHGILEIRIPKRKPFVKKVQIQ